MNIWLLLLGAGAEAGLNVRQCWWSRVTVLPGADEAEDAVHVLERWSSSAHLAAHMPAAT